ncbi:MAG: iron-sulfur cluster assembly scaffold protein [Desulfuromonas sp.]|nr:MAG: iron-sulfur cluster assembly scaffold protein [Desulfuromonas sp.]
MYTEIVMEHFNNPRNVGIIKEPTVLVQIGDPSCGDSLLMSLKIEKDRIADIKYKIYGCGAAVATSSIASEMVMGKSLDDALKVDEKVIADALGGLPPDKLHCSNLAAGAIRGAINEYRKAVLKGSVK